MRFKRRRCDGLMHGQIIARIKLASSLIAIQFAQVSQLQAELTAFEQTRRNSDRVDFLEFARFVEARRQLNAACRDSTQQLVMASAEIMNPRQRERYIQLVTAAGPLAALMLN